MKDLEAETRRISREARVLFIASLLLGALVGTVLSRVMLKDPSLPISTYPYSAIAGWSAAGLVTRHKRTAATLIGAAVGFIAVVVLAVIVHDGNDVGGSIEYAVYAKTSP